MAIWTSRYNNKELQNSGYYPVGISVGQPRFRLGYELKGKCYLLAPKRDMLSMDIEKFRQVYYEKLKEIGVEKVICTVRQLVEMAENENKELVLLCFEDIRVEGEWCHRSIFSDWWMKNTGERIRELSDPTLPKVKYKQKDSNKESFKEVLKEENNEQVNLFDFGMIR